VQELKKISKSILTPLLDIFYPRFCAICKLSLKDSQNRFLCPDCEHNLEFIGEDFCKRCGAELGEGYLLYTSCPYCKGHRLNFKRMICLGRYGKNFRELILQLKFYRASYLVKYLGKLLAEKLSKEDFIPQLDFVTPVPMKKWKIFLRGYNQAELLAKELTSRLRIKYKGAILKKIKQIPPQSLLSDWERRQNVRGAFGLKSQSSVKDKKILLVDDVYTTGSTINECAKTLLEGGAREIYVAVLARSQ
jgi:ComF family protein